MKNRRAIKIKTALMTKGFTQAQIARDLGITQKAISLYVYGNSSSSRFDNWIKENLGEDFFNQLQKVA